MVKKGKGVLIALTQIFILTIAIVAFSFIAGSQFVSADSPSLRTIPGGRSADPYTTQQIKALSQMSAEEIYGKYNNMEVSSESQEIPGPRKNVIDGTTALAVGGISASLLLNYGIKKAVDAGFKGVTGFLASNFAATVGMYFNVVGAAFAGAQLAKLILNIAGASVRNMQLADNAAMIGGGIGAIVGTILVAGGSTGPVGWIAAGVALVATFIFQAFGHQKYSREVFTYEAKLWQPVKGGEDCEKCNDLKYGCSEYQCHTFGTACVLINPDTEDALCHWENKDDIEPPKISPMEDSLLTGEYAYVDQEEGVKLTYRGGCLPAFKGVTFGIQTDKPSQCFYDLDRKESIGEMTRSTNFGSSAYVETHKVAMSNINFPSQFAIDDLGLNFENGKEQNIYFMCESVNGVPITKPYVLSFCVDDSPDLTAPEITDSTPVQGAYITAGVQSMDLAIVTDEPADCSWDFNDVAYENMANPMRNCSQNFLDYRFPPYKYGCLGTINGLKDDFENKYYIRCKDKPSLNLSDTDQEEKRVANEESYVLKLQGTKALVLDKVTINGQNTGALLKDSTDSISVTFEAITSQGAEKNGNAKCRFKSSTDPVAYEFLNEGELDYTSTNIHTTNLFAGDYSYEMTCCDLANNCDSKQITFTIETDTQVPLVARAYKDEGSMKVVTTEYANCFYGTDGCTFAMEDGVPMTTYDNIDHTTPWDEDIDKYIKCEDRYGNYPTADCSIIVRAHKK